MVSTSQIQWEQGDATNPEDVQRIMAEGGFTGVVHAIGTRASNHFSVSVSWGCIAYEAFCLCALSRSSRPSGSLDSTSTFANDRIHAGMLLEGDLNQFASGSGSVPSAGATYDDITRKVVIKCLLFWLYHCTTSPAVAGHGFLGLVKEIRERKEGY